MLGEKIAWNLMSCPWGFFEFHRFGKHQNAEREVEASNKFLLPFVSDCGKFAYDIIKPWPYLGASVSGYPKLLLLRQPQYSQSRYSHHEIGPKAYLAPASREITTLIERIPTMWLLASWFEAVWALPLWSSYFFSVGMDWFGSQVLSALMYFCYSMASAMNTGRSFGLTSISKIICYNI